MRSIALVFATIAVAAAVLATDASAAKIFGDIKADGKPLPEGVKVRVTRPGRTTVADSTTTDKFGSYKLLVKEEGKSVLTVVYNKQSVELAVFSNKEATRYDLVLDKKDGKLILRRK
jgi:hypothetical protein